MIKPLVLLAFLGLCCASAEAQTSYAPVVAGQALSFPKDQGSHPQYRTEWWYVTGWLTSEAGESLGFQITFFRTKPNLAGNNPSAFAPTQIMIAHCALSDPKHGRLWQDQRIARAALGLAGAAEGDTHVWIGAWSLQHDGQYVARIAAEDFSLDLRLSETRSEERRVGKEC